MSTSSTSTRNRNPLRNFLTYLHRQKASGDQNQTRNNSIASASTCVGSEFESKGKGEDMSQNKNGDRNGNGDVSEDVVHHEAIATSFALK